MTEITFNHNGRGYPLNVDIIPRVGESVFIPTNDSFGPLAPNMFKVANIEHDYSDSKLEDEYSKITIMVYLL